MNLYALFLKRPSGQSAFRVFATFFSIVLASFILSAIISLGQGWMTRNEKNDLASVMFSTSTASSPASNAAANSIYFSVHDSAFDELSIKELGIHKTNPADVIPLGMAELPINNEVWVTPALKELIDDHSSLAQRYDGYVIRDTFPNELAPSSDSLMLLYSIQPNLIHNDDAQFKIVTTEELWQTYNNYIAQDSAQTTLLRTALLMVGVILVVPLLLLVTEVSRIGITQREKKYAALSLVGATSAQIRMLAAIETVPLGLLGSAFGVLLFVIVGVPILGHIPIGGSTFWEADLGLSMSTYVVVCCIVTFCSFVASLQAFRSVKVSPLTVTRTNNDMRRSTILSMLPLLIGLGGIFTLAEYGSSWYDANTELGGIILVSLLAVVTLGIFMSGQFITRLFSILLIKCSRDAATTIAAYRLRTVARKTFRSISGIILALFAGTILMTFLATMQLTADKLQSRTESAMVEPVNPLQLPLQVAIHVPQHTSEEVRNALAEKIADTEDLSTLVSNAYVQKAFREVNVSEYDSTDPIEGNYYESCEQLHQRTVARCSKDMPLDSSFAARLQIVGDGSSNNVVIQPQFIPTDMMEGALYDDSYVFIAKDPASFSRVINAAHTVASIYQMSTGIPLTVQYESFSGTTAADYVQSIGALVMAILTLTMVIGGLSIFVSVTGSIFERKRTFVRLRILGSDTATLTKALLVEIIVPLIGLSVVVVGLGIFCCYCVLSTGTALNNGQLNFSMPGAIFWIGVSAAIMLCALVSLINIPLLNKLTSFDDMRSE